MWFIAATLFIKCLKNLCIEYFLKGKYLNYSEYCVTHPDCEFSQLSVRVAALTLMFCASISLSVTL